MNEVKINYVNDRLHGITKSYYKNGKLALIDTYKDNFPHGERIFYDESTGLAYKKETYKNGVKIKTEELYKI